jgi:hypothetical protein
MRSIRPVILVGVLTASALALSGCDAMIWGPDGARVIDTTEQLIDDVVDGGDPKLLCADAELDLGTPAHWEGRSAGEPERFTGEHWNEKIPLDPQWSINLEGHPEGAQPGDEFPGDVFYRDGDDGLCVIDVAWVTLGSVG